MKTNNRSIYRSGIDWWLAALLIATLIFSWWVGAGSPWWLVAILVGGQMLLYAALILGCWYEIEDDNLIVRFLFMPTVFPISKISEVRMTTGYLSTAGMSRHRVSIRFTDRSILKSTMPLEISPANRPAFIAHLLRLNPSIATD